RRRARGTDSRFSELGGEHNLFRVGGNAAGAVSAEGDVTQPTALSPRRPDNAKRFCDLGRHRWNKVVRICSVAGPSRKNDSKATMALGGFRISTRGRITELRSACIREIAYLDRAFALALPEVVARIFRWLGVTELFDRSPFKTTTRDEE